MENGENHRAAEEVTGVADTLLLHIRKMLKRGEGSPVREHDETCPGQQPGLLELGLKVILEVAYHMKTMKER